MANLGGRVIATLVPPSLSSESTILKIKRAHTWLCLRDIGQKELTTNACTSSLPRNSLACCWNILPIRAWKLHIKPEMKRIWPIIKVLTMTSQKWIYFIYPLPGVRGRNRSLPNQILFHAYIIWSNRFFHICNYNIFLFSRRRNRILLASNLLVTTGCLYIIIIFYLTIR